MTADLERLLRQASSSDEASLTVDSVRERAVTIRRDRARRRLLLGVGNIVLVGGALSVLLFLGLRDQGPTRFPVPPAASAEATPLPAVPVDRQLRDAVIANDAGRVATALDSGAQIDAGSGRSGLAPLHLAAINASAQAAGVLLDRGAAIDVVDARGMTALIHAIDARSVEVSTLLIAAGADVDHQSDETYGPRPIHVAAENGLAQVIELLLAEGVDPNRLDGNNSNALHWAAKSDAVDSIAVLIAAGTDVGLVDDHGDTPLDLTASEAARTLLLVAQSET